MRLFAAIAAAALALAAPAAADTVLIKGGRVVTNAAAGTLEVGDVLVRDGRIAAVGPSIAAPAGARVVDASGRWVTPGVFSAMSQVGLYEIQGSGAPNDAEIKGNLVSAGADASDAYNPSASAIAITRIEGVTRAAVAPAARATIFGGRGALVALDGGTDSVFAPRAFETVLLGEDGAERVGGSRAALWPALDAALQDAREYPGRYRSGQGGQVLNEIDAAALKRFAEGGGLFVVVLNRASDIRELIAYKRAHPQLKFALYGAAEGWLVASELAAAQIPVIVDPFANLPAHLESIASRMDNAALLAKAGVTVAIAADPDHLDGSQSRLAPQLAGNAVAHGMPWDQAFAAITLAPAKIYGVDKELGSLAAGKIADVVVWDGDPLEVKSAPVAVMIAGRDMPLSSRQTMLRDRYNPMRK